MDLRYTATILTFSQIYSFSIHAHDAHAVTLLTSLPSSASSFTCASRSLSHRFHSIIVLTLLYAH